MARRAMLMVTALAVVAAGCGGSGDDPILVPPSSDTAGGSSTPSPVSTAPLAPAEIVELTVVDTVPDDAPELVLATAAGVSRWSVTDGPGVLIEVGEEVRHVVDDGNGGVVGLTVDDQLLGSVRWWPADDEEVLLRSQGGLALHDATVRNGDPSVVITYSPIDSDEPAQVLDILDLATTSSRTVRQVGDATTGAVSAAASETGFAVTQVDGACASVITIDDAGEIVDDRVLPETICRDEAPAYGPIGLSEDGARLVVAVTDSAGAVSVLTATTGTDTLIEYPLADVVDAVTAVDVHSSYVVITSGQSTHLIDLDDATIVDLGVEAHSVQMVRRP